MSARLEVRRSAELRVRSTSLMRCRLLPSSSGGVFYRFAYRVGFTPWEPAGVPDELRVLVEGADALAPGRALDLGCGAGAHSVYLAARGWDVTGVDFVDRALERGRERARSAGVSVRWVRADVTHLEEGELEPGYTLLYDHGCLHGLPSLERDRYARQMSRVAAPGAVLFVMAFAPRHGPGPSGVSAGELAERLGDAWELVSSTPSSEPAPPGPMRNAELVWHQLRKRDH